MLDEDGSVYFGLLSLLLRRRNEGMLATKGTWCPSSGSLLIAEKLDDYRTVVAGIQSLSSTQQLMLPTAGRALCAAAPCLVFSPCGDDGAGLEHIYAHSRQIEGMSRQL